MPGLAPLGPAFVRDSLSRSADVMDLKKQRPDRPEVCALCVCELRQVPSACSPCSAPLKQSLHDVEDDGLVKFSSRSRLSQDLVDRVGVGSVFKRSQMQTVPKPQSR